MKYRDYVERYFLIDEPKGGKLVPFIFRPVQEKYYNELVRDYDIENKGLTMPIREIILKARKEGFTSLVLALFAVDDLINDNPTETLVISYKDDATDTFRKRYRNFLLSASAKKLGYSVEQIQQNPSILDEVAKKVLSVDSIEFELAHNKAHFYCGTASARVGGRGGTVQKLLFSEAGFYPDKKELRAQEIIDGTAQQMDIESGWQFVESTANGDLNYFARMWKDAVAKTSRYIARFFSWMDFYTPEQFELIKAGMTDKRKIPQEYPATAEEAFLSSGDRFFDPSVVTNLRTEVPKQVIGNWRYYGDYQPGHRFAGGSDVSEGVGRHNSTIAVIDFDARLEIDGKVGQKPKVVALFVDNRIAPDLLAHEVKSGGQRYGNCLMAIERNNHGWATLTAIKPIYFNLYKDENDKLGWQTNLASKPRMLHELRTGLHEGLLDISDEGLKQEILSYPSIDLNIANVDEEDETQGHYDRVIALAIAWQMRGMAQPAYQTAELKDPDIKDNNFDKYATFNEF